MMSIENGGKTETEVVGLPAPRVAVFRLLVIPLAVYAAWVLETFLLEKTPGLFTRIDQGELILYTVVACILTGIIVPFLILRKSFLSGDVNMFQIGFRSLPRTLTACMGTLLAGYVAVIVFSPFGPDRSVFANAFLLFLPTAMASVMICWVLAGTHIQAFVRGGGLQVSIPVGVIMTALLFGLTTLVHSGLGSPGEELTFSIGAGIISAIFFFAIRDVYATTIAVAGMCVFLMAGRIDPLTLAEPVPAVYISSALAILVLAIIHLYLSRNYTTIKLPVLPITRKD
jgi:hypothetical protein